MFRRTRYPRAVIDESFFLTVAGIAMSFAGFAGLMNALRRRGHGMPIPTRVRATFTTITVLGVVALLGTAITGALPVYRIALILMLAMPAGTFVYVIARIKR